MADTCFCIQVQIEGYFSYSSNSLKFVFRQCQSEPHKIRSVSTVVSSCHLSRHLRIFDCGLNVRAHERSGDLRTYRISAHPYLRGFCEAFPVELRIYDVCLIKSLSAEKFSCCQHSHCDVHNPVVLTLDCNKPESLFACNCRAWCIKNRVSLSGTVIFNQERIDQCMMSSAGQHRVHGFVQITLATVGVAGVKVRQHGSN